MIHPTTLQGEEKVLYNRLVELCDATQQKYKAHFSFFLNPREQRIALSATSEKGKLSGGYEDAQRKLMGIFPDYESEFPYPISAVEIIHQKDEVLSHRDVLGTIMGMGIARGSIGDIIPNISSCTVICTDIVASVLIDELKRIGRNGVSARERSLEGIESTQKYDDISGTISSNRLDSVVAILARCSRAKAVELINSGLVQHDYIVSEKSAVSFDEGSTITIRGHGKFIVDSIGQPTRKGRFPVECRKYI